MAARGRWAVVVWVVVAGLLLPGRAAAQTVLGYGMDETTGTVMMGTGGAPNGSITGDVTLGMVGHTGAGGDGAYAFNQHVGSCDSQFNVTGTGAVKIPSSSVFVVGTQPFSFSVWLRTTTVPLADSGATKNCDFDVVRRSSRWKLELLPKGTSPNRYGAPHCAWKGVLNGATVSAALTASGSDVTDGAWHQITCARTASGEKLLVNGVVKATSSTNVGAISSTAPIYVARNPSADDYYEGLLDDLTFTIG
jgi:concanavalin A-like lectin/glucanase superfamily protein